VTCDLCLGQIKDGMHMANRTVTFTDFGEWSIHPRTFEAQNTNERLIRWITVSAPPHTRCLWRTFPRCPPLPSPACALTTLHTRLARYSVFSTFRVTVLPLQWQRVRALWGSFLRVWLLCRSPMTRIQET